MVDGLGNLRREGAADGVREAVLVFAGLRVRRDGWVEGGEVREDGRLAIEEESGGSLAIEEESGGSLVLSRVHSLDRGKRGKPR